MTHSPRERVLWSIGILVVLLYALIPVAWIASLSLKTARGDRRPQVLVPGITTDNYEMIFNEDFFNAALVNSLGIAAIATLISITLAAAGRLRHARLDFSGKALILSGALAVAMFPPISVVGSLFDMWRAIGLYDTWLGLIIPYMTFTLPLAIYTLTAFFREIPGSLSRRPRWTARPRSRHSARSSSRWPRRACSPPRSSYSSSRGTTSSSRTRSPRPRTPGRCPQRSPSSRAPRGSRSPPVIAAAAVVVTVPIIILVFIFQRRIVAGLTAGAVKG